MMLAMLENETSKLRKKFKTSKYGEERRCVYKLGGIG